MSQDLPTFVTHLECSAEGTRYEADRVHGLSDAGKPILVRYDLKALAKAVDKETLARRPGGFWRYREFLPVRRAENVVSLGEAPVVPLEPYRPGRFAEGALTRGAYGIGSIS